MEKPWAVHFKEQKMKRLLPKQTSHSSHLCIPKHPPLRLPSFFRPPPLPYPACVDLRGRSAKEAKRKRSPTSSYHVRSEPSKNQTQTQRKHIFSVTKCHDCYTQTRPMGLPYMPPHWPPKPPLAVSRQSYGSPRQVVGIFQELQFVTELEIPVEEVT